MILSARIELLMAGFALLFAVCTFFFGWAGFVFAVVIVPLYVWAAKRPVAKRFGFGNYIDWFYWRTNQLLEASEAGRPVAAFNRKARIRLYGTACFLILILPVLIVALKNNSPVAYSLWEGLWRPLTNAMVPHLPVAVNLTEALREFGHAGRIPYAQHIVVVCYVSFAILASEGVYRIWKYTAFAAQGAYDHMVFAPSADDEERYGIVNYINISYLVLSALFAFSGYFIHVRGFILNKHIGITYSHTKLSNADNESVILLSVFVNAFLVVIFTAAIITKNYYECGRMFFPTVKKMALLKERMQYEQHRH